VAEEPSRTETTRPLTETSGPHGTGLVGTMIGRYEVLERVGRGGMGEVYRVRDTLLRRVVALKRLAGRAAGTPTFRNQVLAEARKASRLNDPRIAAVHDVLEHDGEVLIVMEYVAGPSLREILSDEPDLDRFWGIAEDCVRALQVAHEAGLVHRDIKPENVMLDRDGRTKILDFGLARRMEIAGPSESVSTRSVSQGIEGGTPSYMPPEVHLGLPSDHRADLFSLGIVFYELLTGRHPFRAPTMGGLIERALHHDPPAPSDLNLDVPRDLSRVVLRMLAKKPEDRHPSATEVLHDLHTVQDGGRVRARRLPSARFSRRVRLTAGVGALAAAVAVALVVPGPLEGVRTWLGIDPLPDHVNLAVLPPRPDTPSPDAAPLALGLTSMLRDGLARLSSVPPLQVASLTGALREGVETPTVARQDLGANLALEIDLRVDDHTLAAKLELIDTASGRVLRRRDVPAGDSPRHFLETALHVVVDMLELPTGDLDPDHLLALGGAGAGTLDFHLRGLGRLLAARDTSDVRHAIDWFELGDRTDPGSALNLAGLARARYEMFRRTHDERWLGSAEDAAREAAALEPSRSGARELLAFVLWDRGLPEEAIDEMRRALELDPTSDDAIIALGRFHGRRGFVEAEEEIYRNAARERPHCWKPYYWLATKVYYEHGRFEEARVAFAEMIRRSPELHIGYESLGGLQVLDGEYDTAIATLNRAISLRPSAEALTNLGAAYFNQRDFDRAIRTFNQVLRLNHDDYLVWINLGDAYYLSPGKRSLAGDAYLEAIRLGREIIADRPYDVGALAHLARVFSRVNEPDSARSYMTAALRAEPDNPVVHYCAALTCWELGERDQAIDWLEQAVASGHPVRWLRDSPAFDEWRELPGFRELVRDDRPPPDPTTEPRRRQDAQT